MKLKILAALSILLLIAHAAPAGVYMTSRAARLTLADILDGIERNGPDAIAADRLAAFVERYPLTDVTGKAISTLVNIYKAKEGGAASAACYGEVQEGFRAAKSADEVRFLLARCRLKEGRIESALELLDSIEQSRGTTPELKASVRALREEMAGSIPYLSIIRPKEAVIAALLPLKGRYAPFGQKALKGIRLASRVFEKSNFPVKIRPVDTSASPVSEAALKAQGDDLRVVALVGPLLSANAVPVASYAEEAKIPVIVLSQKEGVAALGEYVFRNFLTPRAQARAVARYAYYRLGLRSFTIIHPRSGYGTELARHFKLAVIELGELGARVAGEASYKPRQTDFTSEVGFVFGIETEEVLEGRRHVSTHTPTVEADALYIPGPPQEVSLIIPFLDYFNVEGVRLLGSNAWNTPRLIELAGEYVEGAVFADSFFAGSTRPETMEFTKRFTDAYGYEPGVIEAQAYDAATTMLEALGEGPTSREGLKERLRRTKGIKGAASGTLGFDEDGEARRKLFLLTVEEGRIVELPE